MHLWQRWLTYRGLRERQREGRMSGGRREAWFLMMDGKYRSFGRFADLRNWVATEIAGWVISHIATEDFKERYLRVLATGSHEERVPIDQVVRSAREMTTEQAAQYVDWVARAPERRDPECVKNWPDCVNGEYNPSCCRFPKSCSC